MPPDPDVLALVRNRIELLEAIQRLNENLPVITDVLARSESRADAESGISAALSLSSTAAAAVLDASVATLGQWRQAQIAAELSELRSQLHDNDSGEAR
jgi:DNA gyrase/topoisomerase IV subunit A